MNMDKGERFRQVSEEKLEKFRKELTRLEHRVADELIPLEDIDHALKELDYHDYNLFDVEEAAEKLGYLVRTEAFLRDRKVVISAYVRVGSLQPLLDHQNIAKTAKEVIEHASWYNAA